MYGGSSIKVPIIASDAFYRATQEMMFNETANWIKYDHQSIDVLSQTLWEMGQTRFINMNAGTQEARISLVLYAGDGNIVKIMPRSYSGNDYALQVPAVSERTVETDTRSYVIRTYPYILSRAITEQDVETMRRTAGALGMEFNPGDDTPRNLIALPDKEGTLASIDADTFRTKRDGLNHGPELVEAWRDYIAELFPVYKQGELPPQTANTKFNLKMNYNPKTGFSRFEPLSDTPVIYARTDGPPAKARHSFWDIFARPGYD